MSIEAVIFDMDGVISDTQKYHAKAESRLLKEHFDISLCPEKITERFAGVANKVMFEQILSENDVEINVDKITEIVSKKWDVMFEILDTDLQAIHFVEQLIDKLRAAQFRLAVASASTPKFINRVIKQLGLLNYFEFLVSASNVENGKPAPDIFLRASSLLGVPPQKCVVIEDGVSGMIGANRAGMKSIGLVSEKDKSKYPATLLVQSLEELDIKVIQNI